MSIHNSKMPLSPDRNFAAHLILLVFVYNIILFLNAAIEMLTSFSSLTLLQLYDWYNIFEIITRERIIPFTFVRFSFCKEYATNKDAYMPLIEKSLRAKGGWIVVKCQERNNSGPVLFSLCYGLLKKLDSDVPAKFVAFFPLNFKADVLSD
jgi:hypothetical protein